MTREEDMQSELPVKIYSSESSLSDPLTMLKCMFADVFAGRELAWRLAVRDIRAQYRQTFLGMMWVFFLPLANTIAWLFLHYSGIATISSTALPYPVYVLSGTMLWAIFMDALSAPLQRVDAARSMLAKLNFPREALILSGLYQTFFNAVIKIVLLIVVLLYFGINPGVGILFFPIGLLSLILVGTAIGLMLTPIGMLYTDVGKGLPLLMQFAMYITPVVFPIPKTGWAAALFEANPLTPIIQTCRDWLTGFQPEYLAGFIVISIVAFLVLLVVWVMYRVAMPILIERMSA